MVLRRTTLILFTAGAMAAPSLPAEEPTPAPAPSTPSEAHSPAPEPDAEKNYAALEAKVLSLENSLLVMSSRLQMLIDSQQGKKTSFKDTLPPTTTEELKMVVRQKLNHAIELLQKKKEVGAAFMRFSDLNSQFTKEQTEGEPLYWLGRCWLELKEYGKAQESLQSFLDNSPKTQAQRPEALYYLAVSQWGLGLKKKAFTLLQKIIKDFPVSTVTEQSKKTVQLWEKSF